MRVGSEYTPESFLTEGLLQGFSKRISQIPQGFKLGKTVVYLAHKKACPVSEDEPAQEVMPLLEENQPKLLDAKKVRYQFGIFTAFMPQRIEKIYWQDDLDNMSQEEMEGLKKRHITPVGVPTNDARFK
jgi:hypothetical protein